VSRGVASERRGAPLGVLGGVHIASGDDMGRERLLRYGARPPLALDRLRRLRDGRITYRIKYARPGSKHRVMTPLEMLARLSALIPPPRYPLVRFHGVLGPRSAWRKDVVPKPREPCLCRPEGADKRVRRPHDRTSREPPSVAPPIQECTKCHGRLRVIGTVLDPVAAHAILVRLALPTRAPSLARARDPTELVWSENELEPLGAYSRGAIAPRPAVSRGSPPRCACKRSPLVRAFHRERSPG